MAIDLIKLFDDETKGKTKHDISERRKEYMRLHKAEYRKQRHANGYRQRSFKVPVDYAYRFKNAVAVIEGKELADVKPIKAACKNGYVTLNVEFHIANEDIIVDIYNKIRAAVKA